MARAGLPNFNDFRMRYGLGPALAFGAGRMYGYAKERLSQVPMALYRHGVDFATSPYGMYKIGKKIHSRFNPDPPQAPRRHFGRGGFTMFQRKSKLRRRFRPRLKRRRLQTRRY